MLVKGTAKFGLLVAILLSGFVFVPAERVEAETCEDCWECQIAWNPDVYDCCPYSSDGEKTCGLVSDDCTREIIRADDCYTNSYGCHGTSNSCSGAGGDLGGDGDDSCHVQWGTLCPAECMSCTYYYY